MDTEMLANSDDLKVPLIARESDEEAPRFGRSAEPTTAAPSCQKHSLGFGALVFLIYYNIGVPFGDEGAVKAAGPFMVTLAFFVVLPIVWQLPICFITAELTTTFQDHRGSIAWVSEAFGAQWGFIDAVWSLATSFLDNALYPLIIADFLGVTGTLRWAFVYASIAGLTWAVYRGSAVVASAEEAVFALTMLPLALIVGMGLLQVDWRAVATPPAFGDVDWKMFVQIMFWTSTYWQKVASVGPDVKDCAKKFPHAILYAAGMQTLINGTLHMVAAGATDPALYPEWQPGYLRHAADAIAGGKWLGVWLAVTAAVANSGSFLSEMSVTSQTLIGMSERGLLPKRLMNESRHGTYPWALGTIAGLIAISQPLDFNALVLVCNFLYTLQTFLELAAFYRLRTSLPGLRRPYRVPGGRVGAVLAVGFPCATLVAVSMTVTASAAAFGSAIAAGTVIAAHLVFRRRAERDAGDIFLNGDISSCRGGDEIGNGERGEGLTWKVTVVPERKPRQDEVDGEDEDGPRVEPFEGIESGEQDDSCHGGDPVDGADATEKVKT